MPAHDVFISYASKDASVAQAICTSLESNSVRCWIAPRDIRPGERFGEAIIQGIKSSRIMVFVFSPNSNTSEHTVREIERAVSYKLTIIPFRIANVLPSKELEYFLSAPQWLDATGSNFDKGLASLVTIVSQELWKLRAREHARLGLPPPPSSGQPVPKTQAEGRRLVLWICIGGALAFLLFLGITAAVMSLTRSPAREPVNAPPATPTNESPPPDQPAPSGSPVTVQELANRGILHVRRGESAGAIEDFSTAIRLSPESGQLHSFRAQAYAQAKSYDAAISDWSRFIQLLPGSYEGYSGRGQSYLHKGDCDRALADFSKVLELKPDAWLGYELMGDAYRKKGDSRRVIEFYQMELSHKPPDPAALYYYMAEAASRLGETAQGASFMTRAKALDPNVARRLTPK